MKILVTVMTVRLVSRGRIDLEKSLTLTRPAVPDAKGHRKLPMEHLEESHERRIAVGIISRMSGPDFANNTW